MAYSDITQLRNNVSPANLVATISDANVTDKIDKADNIVEIDLSKVVDFDDVVDTPAGAPIYINKLSQYKTAELVCVWLWGAKREGEEQTDRQYWEKQYNTLLDKVFNGEIDLEDVGLGTNVFENVQKAGIEPALGMGKHGGWIDDDDLEAQRGEFGGQED